MTTTKQAAQNKTTAILKRAIFILLVTTVFVIPIVFIPVTADAIAFNKQTVLLTLNLTVLILWGATIIVKKNPQIVPTFLDTPLIIFLTANLTCLILASNRIVTATTLWTWIWIFLPILYWAVINNIGSKKQIHTLQKAVLINAGILALWNVLQYIFAFDLIAFGITANRAFSPFGSTELLSIYLLTAGGMAVGKIINQFIFQAENKPAKNVIPLSCLILLVIVAVLLVSPWTANLATKLTSINLPRPAKLDLKTAWSVASGTIRNKPIAGAGTGLFDTAFNQFKPLSFNSSKFWTINFKRSHNLWLQTLTEKGLVGIIALIVLTQATIKTIFIKKDQNTEGIKKDLSLVIPILILLVSSFFTTWNSALALTFFILLALYQQDILLKKPAKKIEVKNIIAKGVAIVVILTSLLGCYLLGRNYIAETLYKKALKASFSNRVVSSYDYLGKAVNYHPYNTQYRITYSNINYLIAINLSSGEQISENDRNIAQQLISQGIREARIATLIKPQSHEVWLNLGNLYKDLVGLVDGIEDWAIESYNRAINRNPTDPRIHVNKGGVYYRARNYQKAAETFVTATNLKQDYANAYYNLANAFKKAGNTKRAIQAYQLTLIILAPESTDYKIVQTELENLKAAEEQSKEQTTQPGEPQELELSGNESKNTADLENINLEIEQIEAPAEATQSGTLD